MKRLLMVCGVMLGGVVGVRSEAATPDNFEVRTAGDLVAICSTGQDDHVSTAATGFCHGYFVGVYRSIERIQQARPSVRIFCMPPDSPTRTQAIDAFVGWTGARPEQLAKPSVEGVADFLAATFPCPPESGPTNRRGAR